MYAPPMRTAFAPSARALRTSVPPPDAAIEQHLTSSLHRFNHLGQRLDRGGRAVELAAAVVRDDDAGDAVVEGDASVFGCHDALEQNRQRGHGAQPVDVAPVE